MIKELIDYNLRHGSLQVRIEVRSLLCLLTKDNRRATEEMNNLVMTRISSALKGYLSNPDLVGSHFLWGNNITECLISACLNLIWLITIL
jgi:E3 ubiquitin-protein ligase UBR4